MDKYVVLARDLESEIIVDVFGVYTNYRNAALKRIEVSDDNFKYCIEEVDPLGSFADIEPED